MERTHIYTVRVARTLLEELKLIDSDQDFYDPDSEEGFDFVWSVMDNLPTDEMNELIPKERGIYGCLISVETYQSNHPLDPVEWNMDVAVKNVTKLI